MSEIHTGKKFKLIETNDINKVSFKPGQYIICNNEIYYDPANGVSIEDRKFLNSGSSQNTVEYILIYNSEEDTYSIKDKNNIDVDFTTIYNVCTDPTKSVFLKYNYNNIINEIYYPTSIKPFNNTTGRISFSSIFECTFCEVIYYKVNNAYTGQQYEEVLRSEYELERIKDKGTSYGYAPLDRDAKVPIEHLPDDVLNKDYIGVGDGVTDDSEALNNAFNRSNAVIDGYGKHYHYVDVYIKDVENLTIQNVWFENGACVWLENSRNVKFINCTWHNVQSPLQEDGYYKNKNTFGVLICHKGAIHSGSATAAAEANPNDYCHDITFDHCTFDTIWYNQKYYKAPTSQDDPLTYDGYDNDLARANLIKGGVDSEHDNAPYFAAGYPHTSSGRAIHCMGCDGLYVKNCYFTQVKGNGCITHGKPAVDGYYEITDNTFYLNGFGAFTFYGMNTINPKVRRKVCNNQFIGCGLGYMPQDYMKYIKYSQRGVGCAVLLGGVGNGNAPFKAQALCENNLFQDNVESAVEGAIWNPCIGNTITGQGALQDEENCALMKNRYNLDYDLQVRYNPSVNVIYRNYYAQADGSNICDDDDFIIFENNVMSEIHADRASLISLKGNYNVPVIFKNNVFKHPNTTKLYTHILNATFNKGIIIKDNIGIEPYFNNCKLFGNVELDDLKSAYKTDFTKCNLILRDTNSRFPKLDEVKYNPASVTLNNGYAYVDNGYIRLDYKDSEIVDDPTGYKPEYLTRQPLYSLEDNPKYNTNMEYYEFKGNMEGAFNAPEYQNPEYIDTGFDPSLYNEWTMCIDFTGWNKMNGTSGTQQFVDAGYSSTSKGIIRILNSNFLDLGSYYAGTTTGYAINTGSGKSSTTNLNRQNALINQRTTWVLRYKDSHLDIYEANSDATGYTTLEGVKLLDVDVDSVAAGNIYLSSLTKNNSLFGYIHQLTIFDKALSGYDTALYITKNCQVQSSLDQETDYNPEEANDTLFDISTLEGYLSEGYYSMDGTNPINTGIRLFKDDKDWTIIAKFAYDNLSKKEYFNFTPIPLLSCIDYGDTFKASSPGIDISLSMNNGSSYSNKAHGGQIIGRNSWKYNQYIAIDKNSYYSYPNKIYSVIIQRKNGIITYYSDSLKSYGQISGEIATKIHNTELCIGKNSTVPNLGNSENIQFAGKIYELQVYNRAIPISELDEMYPNIFSNTIRTKGSATFTITNKDYNRVHSSKYICIDIWYDLSKYNTVEYARTYSKILGIKIDKNDEIYWIGSGSSTHKRIIYYTNGIKLNPFDSFNIEIVNSGLAPDCIATIKGIKAVLLSDITSIVEDKIDAIDFDVDWEDAEWSTGSDSISVIETESITAKLNFDDEANVGIEPTISFVGDTITSEEIDPESGDVIIVSKTAGISYNYNSSTSILTITGETAGTGELTIALPSGYTMIFPISILAMKRATSFSFKNSSMRIKAASIPVKNEIIYTPDDSVYNLDIEYSCDSDNVQIDNDGTVHVLNEVSEDTTYTITGKLTTYNNFIITKSYELTVENSTIQEFGIQDLLNYSTNFNTFTTPLLGDTLLMPTGEENSKLVINNLELPEESFKLTLGLYNLSYNGMVQKYANTSKNLASLTNWNLNASVEETDNQILTIGCDNGITNTLDDVLRLGAYIWYNVNLPIVAFPKGIISNNMNKSVGNYRIVKNYNYTDSTDKNYNDRDTYSDITLYFNHRTQTFTVQITMKEYYLEDILHPVISSGTYAFSVEDSDSILEAIKGKTLPMKLLDNLGLGIRYIKLNYC